MESFVRVKLNCLRRRILVVLMKDWNIHIKNIFEVDSSKSENTEHVVRDLYIYNSEIVAMLEMSL